MICHLSKQRHILKINQGLHKVAQVSILINGILIHWFLSTLVISEPSQTASRCTKMGVGTNKHLRKNKACYHKIT